MNNIKLFLFLLLPFFLFSQEKEKRLALVIGNANYDKGELKNPVNDARLIASTLDSLHFDVILKENLSTKRDMTAAIREFGSRRSEYDVAFVYYAGHGVQVDDENFLLPTKETFEEEFDVMDYGVSVQNIMRYLRAQTNQVNILILDACRDNPFESSWGNTRSLKGQGLAKIPPPTGSLIAFSTDSGQTAPDGDGENSVYSISLAKNMLLEETSIDQVFRNVRAEVLAESDGAQRPVEATQLTGNTFYLKKPSLEFMLNVFNKNLLIEDYSAADKLIDKIFNKFPNNAVVLTKKGHLNLLLENYLEAFSNYIDAYKIDPTLRELYSFTIWSNKLDGDSTDLGLFEVLKNWWRFENDKQTKSKLMLSEIGVSNYNDLLKICLDYENIDGENPMITFRVAESLYDRGYVDEDYNKINNKFLKAEKYISNFEMFQSDHNLFPNNLNVDDKEWFYISYADFHTYYDYHDEAIIYLEKALDLINKSDNKIGKPFIYQRLGNIQGAKGNFTKAIEYYEISESLINFDFVSKYKLSILYYKVGDYESALRLEKNVTANYNWDYYFLSYSLLNYSIGNYLRSYELISRASQENPSFIKIKDLLKVMIDIKIDESKLDCEKINFTEFIAIQDYIEFYDVFFTDYKKIKINCE
jgi:tetratricopeptide (TPR) repeat protein